MITGDEHQNDFAESHTRPIDVFISYAPPDERHRARLEVHIGLMKRQGLISTWSRAQVNVGGEQGEEITVRLAAARMVLLLVSADYLAHEPCYEGEMMRALVRHYLGAARVVPIIIHACDWQSAPFAKLAPLPARGKPVTSWRNRNEAWADVARGIRAAAQQLAAPMRLSAPGRPGALGSVRSALQELLGTPVLRSPESTRDDIVLSSLNLDQPPMVSVSESGLVGRDEALLFVLEHIGGKAVLLHGPDGVGKTALACSAAQELAPHYGPYIEVDLHGSSDEPLSPASAMAFVLEALDPRRRWSGEEPALTAAYRSALERHRPIVLLDDVRERAQVEPLLLPTGGLLLITSSYPLALPEVHERKLEPLEPKDAAALIRELTRGSGGEHVDEIARLCAYLPFALRVAGGALNTHGWRGTAFLADYLRRLRREQAGEDAATRVMAATFELLEPAARELFCMLGVLPETFDEDVSTWLAVRAGPPIAQLVSYGLIEKTDKPRGHRLHPLARVFARGQAGPTERAIAEGRMAFWTARRCSDTARMLAALESIETVFETLEPTALSDLKSREWLLVLQVQLRLAGEQKDVGAQVRALGKLAALAIAKNRLREAVSLLERRIAIAHDSREQEIDAPSSWMLGSGHATLGDLSRAIPAMQVGVDFAASQGDPALPTYEADVAALRARLLAPISLAGCQPRRGDLQQIRERYVIWPNTSMRYLAIDRSGSVAIVRRAGINNEIEVLGLARGSHRATLSKPASIDDGIALSSDGAYATDGSSAWYVETGEMWQLACGQLSHYDRDPAYALAMTPDARLVAVVRELGASIMNVPPVLLRYNLRGGSMSLRARPCFTEDGQCLAAGGSTWVLLWHLPSGELKQRIDTEHELSCLTLTSDGTRLLTGHSNGALLQWDALRAEKLSTLADSGVAICDLAVTPDGAVAITCRTSGEIQVWDLRSSREIGRARHPCAPAAVAISADARTAVVAGQGVQVIDLDWSYSPTAPAPWSSEADGLANAFLASHVPLTSDGITRSGRPVWGDIELAQFLRLLADSGLGWLTAEGVRAELQRRTETFSGPWSL